LAGGSVSAERALLIGLARSNRGRWVEADSLEELSALALTAGGEVVERLIQIRPRPDPATLLGSGKIEEIKQLCAQHRIDLLIFDQPLSGSQIRNIDEATGVRTVDRTSLILDIFARHARTAEAKTQVELAQLEYRASRLTGFGVELSRLGGGIGTVGPGETKLEVDRRRIRDRIARLRKDLLQIERERTVQRKGRKDALRIALAGYTNAGKSTLMNRLTGAGVKVAPYLFATLDSNTKVLPLNRYLQAYITDTVGFIRNLPHQLIASFRSTLSEIREADLILHVVDASDSGAELKITAVRETLQELDCEAKPTIIVLNKSDRVFEPAALERLRRNHQGSVPLSALTGAGVEELKQALLNWLKPKLAVRRFTLPLSRGDLVNRVYEAGEVIGRELDGAKLRLKVKGLGPTLNRLRQQLREELKRLK
jgi:GTP-binding protein HflX